MEWALYIQKKDGDAFRRLFTEVLISVFNDILTKNEYQYYCSQFLLTKCPKAALKIKDHNKAIEWLLSDDKDLCFEVLGLEDMSNSIIKKAIARKFLSDKKFLKFFTSYAEEYIGNERRNMRQVRRGYDT
jgi:hypothetical protein